MSQDHTTLDLARAFIQAGELDDARATLDAHIQTQPADDDARRLHAEILARLNAPQAALDDLDRLAVMGPDDIMLYANLLEALNRPAVMVLAEGCSRYPDDERLLERYVRTLHPEQARTLIADRSGWRWRQWAGDLAVQVNDLNDAIHCYTDAVDAVAGRDHFESIHARLLLARAGVYLHLNQLDSAESDYQSAAGLVPGDPVIDFNLGIIAARRGHHDRAQALCKTAIVKAPPALRGSLRESMRAAGLTPAED